MFGFLLNSYSQDFSSYQLNNGLTIYLWPDKNQPAAWTSSSYGQIYVAGSGTIEGKTISLILEHAISAGSFGSGLHTIVLP